MRKTVIIDELHLTLRVPAGLAEIDARRLRRTLLGKQFGSRLRRAIRGVVREFKELITCRVTVSR